MNKPRRYLPPLLSGFLAFGLFALAAMTSCAFFRQTASEVVRVEELSDVEFDRLTLKAKSLTRVAFGRLFAEGQVSRPALRDGAKALEFIASDPTATGGLNFLSSALKNAGLTSDEVMLAIIVLEDSLNGAVWLGTTTEPLSPRLRVLTDTVAKALRAVADGEVSLEEREQQ